MKKLLFCMIFITFFYSCSSDRTNKNADEAVESTKVKNYAQIFGVNKNYLRKKFGRPIIDASWVVIETSDTVITFAKNINYRKTKGFVCKDVFFIDTIITKELDWYFSGKTVYCNEIEDDNEPNFSVEFNYAKDEITNWERFCCPECIESFNYFPKIEQKNERIEFVLDKWEISNK